MRTYLVAWGGDKRSADALTLGAVLARTFDARLAIVYVVHRDDQLFAQDAGEREYERLVAEQAHGWLAEAADTVRDPQHPLEVTTHVVHHDSIAHGIIDTAQSLGATLIVIGAGSGARRPVLANPIVSGLLHASPVPVAMAPRGYRKETFPTLTSLTTAVGARPGAHLVIDEAVDAATRAQLPLRLLSLVDLADDRKLPDTARANARTALHSAHDAVAGRCPVTTEIAEGRSLRHAVKHAAWDPRSAVLIGSSRLARHHTTFLGTAAMRMLGDLPVPLIVVPRPSPTTPGKR